MQDALLCCLETARTHGWLARPKMAKSRMVKHTIEHGAAPSKVELVPHSYRHEHVSISHSIFVETPMNPDHPGE